MHRSAAGEQYDNKKHQTAGRTGEKPVFTVELSAEKTGSDASKHPG